MPRGAAGFTIAPMAIELARITLARTPTPLESWDRLVPGLRIKRDDLTGAALSGNKIRKLEYLLADAKQRGKRRVLTCGGIQSNHCRATAVAAAELGLKSRLFLRAASAPAAWEASTGNLRLCQLVGADIRFVTPAEYRERDAIMAAECGPDDYLIPEGGSNGLGAFGYVRCVEELVEQLRGVPAAERPTAIICATGSGGTLAGLALGAARFGVDIPVWGVAVCDDAPTFQAICAGIAAEAHALDPRLPALAPAEFNVLEGWMGRGYALSSPDEQKDLAHVARTTGLLLDPVYTGKAIRPILAGEPRFGDRPLFIHTGGLAGLLS